jgi:hypothetical protein
VVAAVEDAVDDDLDVVPQILVERPDLIRVKVDGKLELPGRKREYGKGLAKLQRRGLGEHVEPRALSSQFGSAEIGP